MSENLYSLSELADRAVKAAVSQGADRCDVVMVNSMYTSVEMERSSVKQANVADDPGAAVRAFRDGSCGFAYCSNHTQDGISKAVDMALSLARAGTPDPDFKDLPLPRPISSVSGLRDESTSSLAPDETVGMLLELADVAGDDSRISSVNGSVGVGTCEVVLANSNGVSARQSLSSIDAIVEAVARSGDTMFSGYDGFSSRRLERSNLRAIALSAREHALQGLAQTRLQTGEYAVIIDPLAVGWIFADAVGAGVNADSVQRDRSYLAGKLGQTIGSEELTVIDDPTLPWATGSTSFDGEGTPVTRKPLIDCGKLVTYLHDSYTAGKAGVESTGSSSRGGAMWSYRRPPSISPGTLVVSPGNSSLEEMMADTKRGVYLRATFDYPNLATGEFSALMIESYTVVNGELGPSVRQSTMGIELLDMFSRVDAVGKQRKDYFGVLAPPIRISSAKVAGSG